MKIKITYETDWELNQAVNAIKYAFPNYTVKISKSDRHPPFFHAYLTIRNGEKH